VSTSLNLTEILSSLQDYMTADGFISTEQRSFYTSFRTQLDAHPGTFLPRDIQGLMEAAREEMFEEVSDEEFEAYIDAVLSEVGQKDLLEIKLSADDIAALAQEKKEEKEKANAEIQQQKTRETEAEKSRMEAEKASIIAQRDAVEQLRKEEHENALAEINAARIAIEEEIARIKAETKSQLQAAEEARQIAEQEQIDRINAEAELQLQAAEEARQIAEQDQARQQAELELQEAKDQAESELQEARNQAELEIQEARNQADSELQEAKNQAESELNAAKEAAAAAQEDLARQQLEASNISQVIEEEISEEPVQKELPDLPSLQDQIPIHGEPLSSRNNQLIRISALVGVAISAIFVFVFVI
jgi:DNA segregation ATPase FtsK/SpoIIIE-like protein